MASAPAISLREPWRRGGGRVREDLAPILPDPSLTPREARKFYACLAAKLREHTGRGYTTVWRWLTTIFGFPWSVSTLKRLIYQYQHDGHQDTFCERAEVLVQELLSSLRFSRWPNGSLNHSMRDKNEDKPRKRRQKHTVPSPRREDPSKGLRETQKQILTVLKYVYPNGAGPSEIARELEGIYREHVTRNAVWLRLKRLEKRGLVVRLPGGKYKLSTYYTGRGYAENIRVGKKTIKREDVHPNGERVSIDRMLYEAWIRTASQYYTPIDSIEIGVILTGPDHTPLLKWAEKARNKLGWSYSKLYYRDGKLYLEHRLDNPPVEAHPAEAPTLRRILDELNNLNRHAWHKA